MTSLFISYSRKDSAAARTLTECFHGQGLDFWIDWEGIPPSVDWWKEIEKGIEEASVFLFLISPDSLKSKVCRQEIEHAITNGKRLIPLVVRDVSEEEVPPELGRLNWIYFRERDEFNLSFSKLISAIKTDYDWVQAHRQLQGKALEWERSGQENSFLLFGKELQDAEFQLATNTSREPYPTDLQREYVHKSRRAVDRRRARNTGLATSAAIALAVLALFGFLQSGLARENARVAQESSTLAVSNAGTSQAASTLAVARQSTALANQELAEEQATIARAGELAAFAISEKDRDLSLALLLGIEAFRVQDSLRTKSTLLELMNTTPRLKAYLPSNVVAENSVAFSPDGNLLALGNGDRTITLWDIGNINDPTKVATLTGYESPVKSVDFSSNGKMLASGSDGGPIILWNVSDPSNPTIVSFLAGNGINTVFSPNGKILATGGQSIILWDLSDPFNPTIASTLDGDQFLPWASIAFNPDGNIFAWGGVKSIMLWDVSNPDSPSTLAILPAHDPYREEIGFMNSIAFNPNGKELASLDYDSVILWDVRNPRKPVKTALLQGESGSSNIAFSADGRSLAALRGEVITLWDVSDSYNPVKLSDIQEENLGSDSGFNIELSFSPDGKTLVSSNCLAVDLSVGCLKDRITLWDLSNPPNPLKLSTLKDGDGLIFSVAFSPDGKALAAGGDNKIALWEISSPIGSPKVISSVQRGVATELTFSPNGNVLVSAGCIKIDTPSGCLEAGVTLGEVNNLTSFTKLSSLKGPTDALLSVAFSPDGRILASAGCIKIGTSSSCMEGAVILWDISNPANPHKLSTLTESTDIYRVAFSRDGKILAAGNSEMTINLWNVSDPSSPTKLSPLIGHSDDVFSVAFSPDGKTLASGSSDNTIILWDVSNPTSPNQLSTLARHVDDVFSVAFSPDGKTLASGGADKTIVLWDVSNPTSPIRLTTLIGHNDAVPSVTFSPDGKILASGSFDGTVILWGINSESLVQNGCWRTGRNFTKEEWAQYFSNEPYRSTCSQWPLEETLTPTPTSVGQQ